MHTSAAATPHGLQSIARHHCWFNSTQVYDVASFDMIVMLKLPYIPGCVEWVFKVCGLGRGLHTLSKMERAGSAPLQRPLAMCVRRAKGARLWMIMFAGSCDCHG